MHQRVAQLQDHHNRVARLHDAYVAKIERARATKTDTGWDVRRAVNPHFLTNDLKKTGVDGREESRTTAEAKVKAEYYNRLMDVANRSLYPLHSDPKEYFRQMVNVAFTKADPVKYLEELLARVTEDVQENNVKYHLDCTKSKVRASNSYAEHVAKSQKQRYAKQAKRNLEYLKRAGGYLDDQRPGPEYSDSMNLASLDSSDLMGGRRGPRPQKQELSVVEAVKRYFVRPSYDQYPIIEI